MSTNSEWPFVDPENTATFTVRQIVVDRRPILLVYHEDEEDGGWQFLDGGALDMNDAMLVSLKTIVKLDPSILDLADLPIGCSASRKTVGDPWHRKKNQDNS